MLKTLEELQAWTATHLKRGRFVDGEDLKQLAQLIENIQHEVSADYVELPKDADGEPIHVGERVQFIDYNPSTVSHMSLADDGWRVYVKYDGGIGTGSGEPKRIRHYHAPTVEDVLRDMHAELDEVTALYVGEVIDSDERDHDEARIFAEYAQRLQLREVDE